MCLAVLLIRLERLGSILYNTSMFEIFANSDLGEVMVRKSSPRSPRRFCQQLPSNRWVPDFGSLPSPRATPARPFRRHKEKMAVAASQTLNQESVSEARDAEKIFPRHPLSSAYPGVRWVEQFTPKEHA